MKTIHSDDAQHDLDEIAYRISKDNPNAALRWLDDVDRMMRLLASNPGMGEPVEHLGQGIRRISLGSCVLYFLTKLDRIELVRVIHGARVIRDLRE